jgi:hypothetical protein
VAALIAGAGGLALDVAQLEQLGRECRVRERRGAIATRLNLEGLR